MVWDRWLKDTQFKGLWTVDGSEALQWPGLGRRLGHGPPPWHVAAMSRTDTKEAGPKGSHPFMSFPPSLFSLTLPFAFPLFLSSAPSSSYFLLFCLWKRRRFSKRRLISKAHSLSPPRRAQIPFLSILYCLFSNLYSFILYALIQSFSSLILLLFHFVVHWVSSECSMCFRVRFSFKVHAFWSFQKVIVVLKCECYFKVCALCHFLFVLATFMCECRVFLSVRMIDLQSGRMWNTSESFFLKVCCKVWVERPKLWIVSVARPKLDVDGLGRATQTL
jgi:hypothetical protein